MYGFYVMLPRHVDHEFVLYPNYSLIFFAMLELAALFAFFSHNLVAVLLSLTHLHVSPIENPRIFTTVTLVPVR
jgi:hypothetical protein